MAELALKIDAGSGYQDGDILCAFNRRRIQCVHAQHICHVRAAPRNASGLIVQGSLSQDWFEATHQYRFERVSAAEIKRVEIGSGAEELLGMKPNERGEAIDVRQFLARRKKLAGRHCIFGEDGAEVWYGGRRDYSAAKLSVVWSAIESKSPMREADHRRWPAGRQDLRSHLFIAVDDFDDTAAADLESPLRDDKDPTVIVQKRAHRIDWEAKLALSSTDIQRVRDRNQEIDLRDSTFTRTLLVETKPLRERLR